ncbi:MAG: hypothetical protein Q7U75_00480, partial [Desulfobacterales bacterium]|nr:hypothetical protein [Desulfobacterales bacterium]
TGMRTAYVCTEWEQARATWQVLKERGVLHADSRVFVVQSVEDLRETTRYLLDHPGMFDLDILDNLTDVQEFIKQDLLSAEKKRDLNVLSIGEWQILVDKTVAVVKAFRDIPNTHFICIGHFGEAYDDRQQRFIRPSVLGKSLPSRLSATVNLMGYLNTEILPNGLRRQIVFAGAANILTKPHSSLRNIEYANLDFILAKMTGKTARDSTYIDWRKTAQSTSASPEEAFVVDAQPAAPDADNPTEEAPEDTGNGKPKKGKNSAKAANGAKPQKDRF